MARIQSSIGLATGLPIMDTVDQLIAISAQPRDFLATRTAALRQQQVAIGELTALTIAIQLSANKLSEAAVFQQRSLTSSDENLIGASVTGNPAPGTYQFTPVRMAQNHLLISDGVASLDAPLGGGSLGLRFGGFTDRGLDLELLNGGAGVERGKIRITDRSGASEVIDLRFALTIDDVLEQINAAEDINVTAIAQGDAIRLIDQTGLAATNLKVQEVSGGNTAADLGLGGIDAASSDVTGLDLVRLFEGLGLSQLNDNSGLSIRDGLPDLQITFRDGSAPLEIDLKRDDVRTLGDLLAAINAADPARLGAALSSDGDRLVLTDLTADSGGTFAVSSPFGGTLAEDLGIATSAAADVIQGGRLLSGLKSPLLSSLSGGYGLGALGNLSLTDRSGATATVNLASAETLSDVIDLINGSGLAMVADINDARSGLVLQDTSGSTTSNLIVGNADATNTADKLGITFDGAEDRVDSGSLNLQTYDENTRLDTLRNGAGIRLGSFLITDSAGQQSGVNLITSGAETVGDVLELINGLSIGVEARINDSGDGILLVDTAGGGGTLTVEESGSRSTAADLNLLGQATVVDIGGTPTQVIDGATSTTVTFDAVDTLQDIVDKINEMEIGVTASIFQGGSGANPYRIALASQVSGRAGEIQFDTSQFGIGFREIAKAADAVLQVGSSNLPGAGILATSSSNQFSDVIDGVELTLGGTSSVPVSITVEESDQQLISNVNLFVDQYNKLRAKIDELTFFDEATDTTGILFGSNETLQIESRLARLMTDRFFGVGSIQSLEEIGISVGETGDLEFDEEKLQEKFDEDPEAVEQFFTTENLGFSAAVNAVIESLAGEGNSLLVNRSETLQAKIDRNNDKIDFFNDRLGAERERLLKYYYNLEIAISKIKSNMSVIAALVPLPILSNSAS